MSDNKVVLWRGITTLPLPPDRVLEAAREANLKMVLIIGYEQDGTEYFAASDPTGPENLWMMARAQKKLLSIGDNNGFIEE